MPNFILLQYAEPLFLLFVPRAHHRQKSKQPSRALQGPRDSPVESCTRQDCWGLPKSSATHIQHRWQSRHSVMLKIKDRVKPLEIMLMGNVKVTKSPSGLWAGQVRGHWEQSRRLRAGGVKELGGSNGISLIDAPGVVGRSVKQR